MEVQIKKIKPKKSEIYNTYWRFAAERQRIFFSRLKQNYPPWTEDSILSTYKFTNAYRAADRVSQYLIKNIIYNGESTPEEVFFRIILFKLFNKIETWEGLQRHLGVLSFREYDFESYCNTLYTIRQNNGAIYSGAYIMASGKSQFGFKKKHENHLKLIEKMMSDKVFEIISASDNMEEVFLKLTSYPIIGRFLGYQFATDINYSTLTNFSEMDFVKAGPGAKDGIRKCFSSLGEYTEENVIEMMTDIQEREFERLGIEFKTLWGRPLQLIDCQNLFCEVDKYSRVAHPNARGYSNRVRIKQRFQQTSHRPMDYFFPPKWNLNKKIYKDYE
ncbi:nucleotide kinase domain-containing protein [uncultured Croceitalea sp.]|uniref:nucleotide kinase domain-containing protein n=1 Tax=uncultured Croceitalea sp. TaxID=1798908 RepID=UPI00330634C2